MTWYERAYGEQRMLLLDWKHVLRQTLKLYFLVNYLVLLGKERDRE